MKIAFCLYGQPRFFDKAFSFYKNNIFFNGDVDVFMHAWFDPSKINSNYESAPWLNNGRAGKILPNTDTSLISIYNPKKYKFEKQINFEIKRDYSSFCTKTPFQSIFSNFYSKKSSIELKKEYEEENKFKYDWAFVARYDTIIHNKINLLNLDNSFYYYPDDISANAENKEASSDLILFSSSTNIDKCSLLYDNIDSYWVHDGVRLGGECLIGWHLHKNGKKKPIYIDYKFIRENSIDANEISVYDL